jgi:hypothetical protein
VAHRVVGSGSYRAAQGRIVTLGFVYPDAIDIRSALPRGFSHVPVRGPASQTSGAQPRLTDPGSTNEPTATHPDLSSAEGPSSSVGGAT